MMLAGETHSPKKEPFERETTPNIMEAQTSDIICIPKIEPLLNNTFSSRENLNVDMEQPLIPYTAPYKLKDPVILLERCDKIWKTLTLIKNAQANNHIDDSSEEESDQGAHNAGVPDPSDKLSYVKYQPTTGNNDENLPNFKLAVKATKKLFCCLHCDKQYSEKRGLRNHCLNKHGFVIPLMKRKRHNRVQQVQKETLEDQKDTTIQQKYTADNTVTEQSDKINCDSTAKSPNNEKFKTTVPFVRKVENVDIKFKIQRQNISSSVNNENTENAERTKKKHTEQHPSKIFTNPNTNKRKIPDVDYTKCLLCYNTVSDIKKHLTNYHKITCFQNIKSISMPVVSKDTEKISNKHTDVRNKKRRRLSEKKSPKTSNKHSIPNVTESSQPMKKTLTDKRSLAPYENCKRRCTDTNNILNNENGTKVEQLKKEFNCEICNASFTSKNGLRCHIRCSKSHVTNQTALIDNDLKSNACNTKPIDAFSDVNGADMLSTPTNKAQALEKSTDNEPRYIKLKDDGGYECRNCGVRYSKRQSVWSHSRFCKKKEKSTTSPTLNSPDRDSGIGISITIKKKNDSYEIVGKDNGDYEKPQENGDLITDDIDQTTNSANDAVENHKISSTDGDSLIPESSKYSKDHSILKIQDVDEDILVDIEDDLPADANNSNNSSNVSDIKKPEKHSKSDNIIVTPLIPPIGEKTKAICICGYVCPNEKFLREHMAKAHPLLLKCGYCKTEFDNIPEVTDHICSISEGELKVVTITVTCSYCNVVLGIDEFDQHTESEHSENCSLLYSCYVCTERFSSCALRRAHVERCHPDFSTCQICYKKVRMPLRKKHEGYHYGYGYPCHTCKQSFILRQYFIQHYKMVHRNSEPRAIDSGTSR